MPGPSSSIVNTTAPSVRIIFYPDLAALGRKLDRVPDQVRPDMQQKAFIAEKWRLCQLHLKAKLLLRPHLLQRDDGLPDLLVQPELRFLRQDGLIAQLGQQQDVPCQGRTACGY